MVLRMWIFHIDNDFEQYFRNLKQVFLSITDKCNLRCKHCLYKPWLNNSEMELDEIKALLTAFKKLGATKLSILGGEPTLFKNGDPVQLSELICFAKEIGYQYVRIVTNGISILKHLKNQHFRVVDEISFSFDGICAAEHDAIRGGGVYDTAFSNLQKAIIMGYNCDVTMTVHNRNTDEYCPEKSIDNMIHWGENAGVQRLNFHPILKMGIPRDEWVSGSYIKESTWKAIYQHIKSSESVKNCKMRIRIPQRFVSESLFNANEQYYGYCPVKLGERVEVHPNGKIQICALLKGTDYSIADYSFVNNNLRIKWSVVNNELESFGFDLKKNHPCAIIKRPDDQQDVPLCISFKPNQDEFVWNKLFEKK